MERTGYILIHGAGLGAWVWDRLLPELKRPAVAVDLPMRGELSEKLGGVTLEEYVRKVVEAAEAFPVEKIVLVGHSVGGEIALDAARRLQGRVAAVILVAAIVPPPGKSMVSLQPRFQRWVTKLLFAFGPTKPPESVIRASLCNGLDEETCRLVVGRYVRESPRLFLDPVDWSPEDAPPRLYVKTLEDRSVLPPIQDLMIARAKASRVETLACGHLPMLAKPKELAALLESQA